ncbi:aminotransferase class I/II-fold pyridoxal phosphate-dependent enzyme [Dactylosporangium sp. NPDC051484]|uniref:aminotransferase class I/II-fold pyridoxal phosphate-dependent enzyme n=1 Tax=Dactylosporangium sp. NPDC051484 TaxID=3154942 RepID=UPI00344BD3C9
MLDVLRELLREPTARGLAEAVSQAVGQGRLSAGAKLPPVRQVADALQVSPTTVGAAWQLLRRSGTIRTDGRRGTTIAETRTGGPGRYRAALRSRTGFPLDLSTGVPDPQLLPPLPPLTGIFPVPGSYLDEPVHPELAVLLRERWPYEPERIGVFDGAMDAIDQIASALLRMGDRVVVERPSFPPLLDLLEAIGTRPVGVDTDAQGILPDRLAAALMERPVAVFLQPRALNPTGASWSKKRAAELALVLARHPAVCVIEDDSAGDISMAPLYSIGASLPMQTVHVSSFSKSHGPDLRLAAVGGPAAVLDPVLERRLLGQGWTSRLLQQLMARLLTEPSSVAAVRNAREEYARRRRCMVKALSRAGFELPVGDGLNLWLPVADEQAALLSLAGDGISAAAGAAFTVGPMPPHLRVTVGLVAEDHDLVASRLARAATAPALRLAR